MKDSELLRRLLEHSSKILSDDDVNAFRGMYYSLINNRCEGLTDKQRFWAESVYKKLDIDKLYKNESKKQTKSYTRYWWEDAKPLKPPTG